MPSTVAVHSQGGKWIYEFEFTVTTSGAIVPDADGFTSTDPAVTVSRTGTGTYKINIPGNFQKTVYRSAKLLEATPTAATADFTAVSLGGGTADATGGATTDVTLKTMDDNATPAAADLSAGTIACRIVFQKNDI